MALDELHARRLATIVNIVESALDRIELLFRSLEGVSNDQRAHKELESKFVVPTKASITPPQIRQARELMESLRRRLREALERFSVRPYKPEPRQILAAELSTLWVVLENARPERMKGYARKFAPADQADWESLVEGLLRDLEQIRSITLAGEPSTRHLERPEKK